MRPAIHHNCGLDLLIVNPSENEFEFFLTQRLKTPLLLLMDGAEGEIRTRGLLQDSPFDANRIEVRILSPAPLTWLGYLRILKQNDYWTHFNRFGISLSNDEKRITRQQFPRCYCIEDSATSCGIFRRQTSLFVQGRHLRSHIGNTQDCPLSEAPMHSPVMRSYLVCCVSLMEEQLMSQCFYSTRLMSARFTG